MAHADHFVTPADFKAGCGGAAPVAEAVNKSLAGRPLLAAVVPHHLAAGHLAAGLFSFLSADPPRVVVLVGPDHFRAGPRVGVSLASWRTMAGTVETDADLVEALLGAGLAQDAAQAQDGEHSVGALMPFLRHYLPGAKVVPLTLRGDVSYEEAVALGRFIRGWAEGAAAGGTGDGVDGGGGNAVAGGAEASGCRATGPGVGGVLVVASVDFSHYLSRAEADANDALTLQALQRGDWPTLFALGSGYLDSPGSLAVAFAFAGRTDRPSLEAVAHTNSASLLGRADLPETTSHFLLVLPGP